MVVDGAQDPDVNKAAAAKTLRIIILPLQALNNNLGAVQAVPRADFTFVHPCIPCLAYCPRCLDTGGGPVVASPNPLIAPPLLPPQPPTTPPLQPPLSPSPPGDIIQDTPLCAHLFLRVAGGFSRPNALHFRRLGPQLGPDWPGREGDGPRMVRGRLQPLACHKVITPAPLLLIPCPRPARPRLHSGTYVLAMPRTATNPKFAVGPVAGVGGNVIRPLSATTAT